MALTRNDINIHLDMTIEMHVKWLLDDKGQNSFYIEPLVEICCSDPDKMRENLTNPDHPLCISLNKLNGQQKDNLIELIADPIIKARNVIDTNNVRSFTEADLYELSYAAHKKLFECLQPSLDQKSVEKCSTALERYYEKIPKHDITYPNYRKASSKLKGAVLMAYVITVFLFSMMFHIQKLFRDLEKFLEEIHHQPKTDYLLLFLTPVALSLVIALLFSLCRTAYKDFRGAYVFSQTHKAPRIPVTERPRGSHILHID